MSKFIFDIVNGFINKVKYSFKSRFSDKINLFLLSTTMASILVAVNCIEKNMRFFSFSHQMLESILVCILFCIFIFYTRIISDKNNGYGGGISLKAPYILLFSLFSSYRILYLYASNITKVPFWWAFCFILLFALFFLCLYWFFKIVFKDDNKAVIVSLIIVFASNVQFNDLGYIRSYFGLIFYFGIFALTFINSEKFVSFLKPFSAALIAFCILNGGYNIFSSGLFSKAVKRIIKKPVIVENLEFTKNPKRDIYIILLDAYAGKRTLTHLGIDNSDFINKLKQKGFVVYENMESNYSATVGSIPSFLNVEYIQNLPYETSGEAVSDAKIFKIAKKADYKIYYINSWPLEMQVEKGIIGALKASEGSIIEDVAELFLDKTMLSRLVRFEENAKIRRAKRMQELFKYADGIIKDNGKKRFVFAHFLMPHAPYIFDENGEVIMGISADTQISKGFYELNKEVYGQFLKFSNKKALEYVDKMFALKREKPIIIIMGDHGTRTVAFKPYEEKYFNTLKENNKYLFNTFIAYYNPDYDPKYYNNPKSHINFFIDFLNENFGTNLKNTTDKHYFLKKTIETFKRLDVYEAKY